jgi:catechol 2,3-dioxygenase-like lactoylglutathione lyase family enzyme
LTKHETAAVTTEVPTDSSGIPNRPDNPSVPTDAMLLELVPIPVADVDRSIIFYRDQVGFRLDVDVTPAPGVRFVQLTPPGSACSILLTASPPTADPSAGGAIHGLHLVVADIQAARAGLISRGVTAGQIEDVGGGVLYVHFADPDGNRWCLQHMPWR